MSSLLTFDRNTIFFFLLLFGSVHIVREAINIFFMNEHSIKKLHRYLWPFLALNVRETEKFVTFLGIWEYNHDFIAFFFNWNFILWKLNYFHSSNGLNSIQLKCFWDWIYYLRCNLLKILQTIMMQSQVKYMCVCVCFVRCKILHSMHIGNGTPVSWGMDAHRFLMGFS